MLLFSSLLLHGLLPAQPVLILCVWPLTPSIEQQQQAQPPYVLLPLPSNELLLQVLFLFFSLLPLSSWQLLLVLIRVFLPPLPWLLQLLGMQFHAVFSSPACFVASSFAVIRTTWHSAGAVCPMSDSSLQQYSTIRLVASMAGKVEVL